MPWTVKTAKKHNRNADEQWVRVANKVLAETGDEGRAIREANAVIKRKLKGRAARAAMRMK